MHADSLDEFLTEAIESINSTDAALSFEITEAAETENISTNVLVQLPKSAFAGSICLSRLIEQLQKKTTVGSIDIVGAPANQVVVFGAASGKNYKIVIQL